MWNQVNALRHREIPMHGDNMTTYALAVPMISQSLIEGVHRPQENEEEQDEQDQHDEQDEHDERDEQDKQDEQDDEFGMQYSDDSDDEYRVAGEENNTSKDNPLLHRAILHTFTRKITDRTAIVKDIFARFPSVVDFRDLDGNTPVHLVLLCRMDPSVLYAFKAATKTDVWDKILLSENRWQQTPMCIALEHHSSDIIISSLVDVREDVLITTNRELHTPIQTLIYKMNGDTTIAIFDMLKSKTDRLHPPAALLNQDAYRHTALHLLLLAANSRECTMSRMQLLIPQLIDECQVVLCMANRKYMSLLSGYDSDASYFHERETPLHMALKMAMPLAVIKQLIDTAGKVLTVQNHDLDTPLHAALRRKTQAGQHGEHGRGFVARNVVLHLMKAVFEKYKTSFFRQYDRHGDTVLHFAIKNKAASAIVKKLVEMEPRALGMRNDIQNNTPLHLALQFKRNIELVGQMINAGSSVLQNINIDGDTPLHVAIKNKASRDIVSTLVIANANVLGIKNSIFLANEQQRRAADTPFSLAIKGSYSLDVVRLLVDHNKAVLSCPDVHGETPVHAALRKKMYGHVKYMFETAGGNPCNLCMHLDRGGRTPLNYMLETGDDDIQMIALLLQAHEEHEDVMMCFNNKGMAPVHTALSMNMRRRVIKMLLPKNPDKLYALLVAKNYEQHTPLNIAENAKIYRTKVFKLLTPHVL